MSLVRKHRERVLASAAAKAAAGPVAAFVAASAGTHIGSRLARHMESAGQAGPRAVALAQILLQLQEDKARLKAIASVEAKVELKRELLPKYDPWIEGIFAASQETGRGVQDEVLATCMLWRLDVGDYVTAIRLASYVLEFGLALPDHIARKPAVLVAEEVAEAAIIALKASAPFSADVLNAVEDLVAAHDMPDQVRAKLHKAKGLELAARIATLGESGIAGAKLAAAAEALAQLRRALQLDPKAGVKKDIERLEREHTKLAQNPAAAEG